VSAPSRPGRRPARRRPRSAKPTAAHDDTRARLLDAGRRLFAEKGYDDVTVRAICREAGANLALVNYHFGGKAGLYTEIVEEAVDALTRFNALACGAPEGSGAEERIAHFVRVFVRRVLAPPSSESWVHKLIQHELGRPTAAASLIATRAMAPRMRWLAAAVGELLARAPDDPRVMQSVGSVHMICLSYRRFQAPPAPLRDAMPELAAAEKLGVDAHAEHAASFVLGGLRAAQRHPPSGKRNA
jgi:AcrR family transcriptional regulator